MSIEITTATDAEKNGIRNSLIPISNVVSGTNAVVGGGESNTASGSRSTVGGGFSNSSFSLYGIATIAGGDNNTTSSTYGNPTVSGGGTNTASSTYGSPTVGGGNSNNSTGDTSTVGGGFQNTASGDKATVAGGRDNNASGSQATVGGGFSNTASGYNATVGGGFANTASTNYATVGGGLTNTASGNKSTVGGGHLNTASGDKATVAGGYLNTASAQYATVIGGGSALANRYGMLAHASAYFSEQGDAQAVEFVARNTTVGATSSVLFLDGNSVVFGIRENTVLSGICTISGFSSTGAKVGLYQRSISIKNVGGTTTLVHSSTISTDHEDDATWNVTITGNNATDSLNISCTGSAGDTVRWVAVFRGLEIAMP